MPYAPYLATPMLRYYTVADGTQKSYTNCGVKVDLIRRNHVNKISTGTLSMVLINLFAKWQQRL